MRVSRASMLLFAALAAVVLAPSGTHARGLLQAQVCVLPATVAPTSQVLVGGSITTPIAAKVRPTSSTTFSGSFAIVFPAPCPTAATLAAALPKAYIATVKGSPGVSLADTKAVVTMGTPPTVVANVLVGGLKGTTLSAVGPAGVAAPTVTATAGTVTTTNSMVPIKPYSLAGQSMLIAGTGCTLGATGATVTFSCPKLSVAQTLNLDVGSGVKGGGSLAIQGSLTATGKLSDAKLVPASTVPAPKA